jgi:hypothetical protein
VNESCGRGRVLIKLGEDIWPLFPSEVTLTLCPLQSVAAGKGWPDYGIASPPFGSGRAYLFGLTIGRAKSPVFGSIAICTI